MYNDKLELGTFLKILISAWHSAFYRHIKTWIFLSTTTGYSYNNDTGKKSEIRTLLSRLWP